MTLSHRVLNLIRQVLQFLWMYVMKIRQRKVKRQLVATQGGDIELDIWTLYLSTQNNLRLNYILDSNNSNPYLNAYD